MRLPRSRQNDHLLLDFSVLAAGGSETYVTGFLDALARRGPNPKLVVLLPAAPALVEQADRLTTAGVAVVRSGGSDAGTWRARVRAQLRLPIWAVRLGVSNVFVPRDVIPLLTPARVTLLAHNRIAWEAAAGSGRGRIQSRLRRLSASIGARRAASVIVTTDALSASLRPRYQLKATTVHQGCDLAPTTLEKKRQGRLADGRPARIIAIGAMSPHKRFDVVIEAVAELRRRGVDIVLDIWGPPGTPDQSQALIQLSVSLLGANPLRGPYDLQDRAAIYARADLLMMGSSFESFGHPMVEAMRTSTVVVAPRSRLVQELCRGTAVTYEEGLPISAADAIEAALPDLASWARRGHDRSANFSWDVCVARTLELCGST